ncbi:MAG: 2-hydroxyacyl-CoA dehydratase family protein [Bacillota bacterium]|nr:2-hydroxyacyl-CoA dehydratase family protein [Bacillota bacterium]
MEQELQKLLSAAMNPKAPILSWKKKHGGKVIGALPIYVPEELIAAAGALPVGLWGGNTEIERANGHLQGFACSIVRGVLELGLKGTYSMVDGFVFPSTCDHIQNTSEIWAKAFPHHQKFDLVYPANRQSKAALTYQLSLLMNFRQWLEELTGNGITDERLSSTISVYNKHRQLMHQLRCVRAENPRGLTNGEMAGLVKASLFLPKEEFNSSLEQILPWLNNRIVKDEPRLRLVLTGIMAEPVGILDCLDELGCTVIADDLALGARISRGQVEESLSPLEGLAQRHLSLGPCSTLYDPNKKRGGYLINLLKETKADGIVFINMKFCEMEEFDYPVIKQEMEQAGIPLLFIEVEQQMASIGQLRTRLQAFAEMLA